MNPNVLLVDDEKGFTDTMIKRLSKRGLEVKAAYSGEEGLAVLNGWPLCDVVVLDVKMPGMDGMEALKRIKAEHPLVEVVMLTGHATVESAIDGMKSGAFDYLVKPSELDDLLGKIKDAYEKKAEHEEKIHEARARHIAGKMGY